MAHYHDENWRNAKEAEVIARQANPDALLALTFLKDACGWYADVPGHTRAQNQMVCGADALIERFSEGTNRVTMFFRTVASGEGSTLGKPLFHMMRVEHDGGGATYAVFGLGVLPRPAWLCNVTESVLGEHPKDIWAYRVECGAAA